MIKDEEDDREIIDGQKAADVGVVNGGYMSGEKTGTGLHSSIGYVQYVPPDENWNVSAPAPAYTYTDSVIGKPDQFGRISTRC